MKKTFRKKSFKKSLKRFLKSLNKFKFGMDPPPKRVKITTTEKPQTMSKEEFAKRWEDARRETQ